ncbi:hypothetical protein E2C01_062536 [Portunus trituberculatus]|uniref:Uncharacterized protein n=1 Tax=Portunus trituberculatus TaxID=210409 RepID=A0A5B7HEB0_PORTR|nr:hypothetical protein [Portunus trituberculatus]
MTTRSRRRQDSVMTGGQVGGTVSGIQEVPPWICSNDLSRLAVAFLLRAPPAGLPRPSSAASLTVAPDVTVPNQNSLDGASLHTLAA